VLVGNLVKHLHGAKLPRGLQSSGVTPAILDQLPAMIRHGLAAGYAESIQTVFIIAAPIGLIAFGASWLIPHMELRRGVGAARGTSTAAPVTTAEQVPLVPATTSRATPTELP
jgi:hypothetical protein